MKIEKTKEVVTEEIDVQPGTYYFECQEGILHKMILTDYGEEGLDYFLESVEQWGSPYGIRVRKDSVFNGEEFPYKFSAFIREISGKKITKRDFDKVKQQVLKRL